MKSNSVRYRRQFRHWNVFGRPLRTKQGCRRLLLESLENRRLLTAATIQDFDNPGTAYEFAVPDFQNGGIFPNLIIQKTVNHGWYIGFHRFD